MSHTNREIRLAIDFLESRGWIINEDGTITRVRWQSKAITRDPRLKNAEPRHTFVLGRKTYSVKVSDIVTAKFGLEEPEARPQPEAQPQPVAAIEQPDEVEVGLRLNPEPETRSRPARVGCDEAEVGLGLSFTPETCPEPARVGSRPARSRPVQRHCGGHMARIGVPWRPRRAWRCFQCGRTEHASNGCSRRRRAVWFRKG